MKKYKIGYTQGVFDMFHIGHLNLINAAKQYCDYLIVGVNKDELVYSYKNKKPIIDENSRATIVNNIKSVDKAVLVDSLNKLEVYKQVHFEAVFIGDDWKGSERWNKTESDLKNIGVDVIYLPYTPNISSTLLSLKIK